jgi:hypothetical protein
MHEKRHDGIVQRRHPALGVFIDEDRDLLRWTFRQHCASLLTTGEQ